SETLVALKLGVGLGLPFTTALRLWAIITCQCPVMAPAPQGCAGQEPKVGVPYHTTSTRPESPAAIQGKRLVPSVGVAAVTRIAGPQCAPWSVEAAMKICVVPLINPVEASTVDCAQVT